jgi:hypothetical protein
LRSTLRRGVPLEEAHASSDSESADAAGKAKRAKSVETASAVPNNKA